MRVSDLNIDRIYINRITRNANYKMVENHFHYYYELYYVRQGVCRFFINNTLYDLHAGDFVVIPPKEIHFNHYLSQCTRYNIYFNESDLMEEGEPFMANLQERFLRPDLIHVPSAYKDKIDSLLEEMVKEDKVDDADTRLLLRLHLKTLFLLCNRHCNFHRNQPASTSAGDEEILQAARYIAEHFSQPITLDILARQANLSPSYFSKKFRQITGMGMKEYLCYVRLEHAAVELLATDHTITDIAINSGFSDSNYFKDAFKKMYGLSPRAYRKERTTDFVLKQSILKQGNLANSPADQETVRSV